LALKTSAVCAIVLSASTPVLVDRESKMGVVVLADTSASISEEDLKRESDLIRGMEGARGEHQIQVIPFARSTRRPAQTERTESWHLDHTPGVAGRATDIERAVHDGIARLPSGRVPRIVILSDGQENLGSVLRVARQAQARGIPIDTIPLAGRPAPGLLLEMVTIPTDAFSGERFTIDLVITSAQSVQVEIVTSFQGKQLDATQVLLNEGVNRVKVATSLTGFGQVEPSVAIHAGNLGELRFSQPLTLRQRRDLVVSSDKRTLDSRPLQALAAAHFKVRRATQIRVDLANEQLVSLNDWQSSAVPIARRHEQDSIARPRARGDELERTLPLSTVPSEAVSGSCFVLMLEKSSSMDGKKMELARLAALEVVENLHRNDEFGILAFDDRLQWVVPIRNTNNRDSINDVIERITAGGGIQIAPALGEGLRRILKVEAASKHIVLLTDGRAEDIDSLALARQAAARHVTISTVGLGESENRAYLTKVAQWTGGKSYTVNNSWEIEPTVTQDTLAYRGSAAVTSGFGSGQFIPRPREKTAQVTTEYDSATDEFVIDYRLGAQATVPAVGGWLVAFTPHGFGRPVRIDRVSERTFRARIRCDQTSGLFRIRPLGESSVFPQVFLFRHDQELSHPGPNKALLQQVSEVTGGRFNPDARYILHRDGRTAPEEFQLWPALVVIALMLSLCDWISSGVARRSTGSKRL
jgi:Mg-chelatase subunit ChlD